MGMYTGLRAKIKLKLEYIEFIEMINKAEAEWQDQFDFGYDPRASFIPRGVLSYMPWDDDDPKFKREINKGIWSFQCSLKNYENTIESFFDNVLPEIAEKIIYLEYYYEEWCYSDLYDFVDGKIQKIKRGNKYDCSEQY